MAEWYVIEMLEKSWAGFETHTEQSYNVGKPCYGYRAKKVPHPVPAKRAKGIKKTLLEVHPVEGPVVSKAFGWRVAGQLGYEAITDRLNEDLVTNPKHTGHMVWNRRARKGGGGNRLNPVSEWVWSPEPTHEPLVDLETFVLAQQVAERRERLYAHDPRLGARPAARRATGQEGADPGRRDAHDGRHGPNRCRTRDARPDWSTRSSRAPQS